MTPPPHFQVRVHPENGVWVADLADGNPADDPLLFGPVVDMPDTDTDVRDATAALIQRETGLVPGEYVLSIVHAVPIQLQVADRQPRTVGWIRTGHGGDPDAQDWQALADLLRHLAREVTAMSADPDHYPAPDVLQAPRTRRWSGP